MANGIMEWLAVCAHAGGAGATQCRVIVVASPPGFGEALGGGAFACGQTITLQARAHWGYRLREWIENGAVVGTTPTLSVTLGAAQGTQRTFTAVFEPVPTGGGGTTPPPPATPTDPGGRFHSETCPHCAARLLARAPGGNALWSTLPCPNCGRNITFWGKRYDRLHMSAVQVTTVEIVTRASPAAGGTVSGAGAYAVGHTARVRAIPNAGFTFSGWYVHGHRVSSSADYSFQVSTVTTLTAMFTAVAPPPPPPPVTRHQITVVVHTDPAGDGGVATGGGLYEQGGSVTLVASPRPGYMFYGWHEGQTRVSESLTFTFTVTGPRTLTAAFAFVGTGQQPAPTPQQPLLPQPPLDGGTAPIGGAAPVGRRTGTIIALAVGGAAVVGAGLWFALRRKKK